MSAFHRYRTTRRDRSAARTEIRAQRRIALQVAAETADRELLVSKLYRYRDPLD